ncbi:hypothetical protein CSUI_003846 [Cystoisospora suis]|uniref:Transmembrane protein n=1 Tax=Cystoisospora suis TaxID=483139 RepID=A0A2C6L407_9APIC|nr:hypothetical protein CSUI_003846 [Cystoisospora suis]
MIPFCSVRLWWNLFPQMARDKVQFYFRYIGASVAWGTGMVAFAGRKDFGEHFTQPSFFYKMHLRKLLRNGNIDRERYDSLMSGAVL